jgi:hypothetical protein
VRMICVTIWSSTLLALCAERGSGQEQRDSERPSWAHRCFGASSCFSTASAVVQPMPRHALAGGSSPVELVVPNTQGAGIMAPPSISAEFLASALATMLLLTPRLVGDRPCGASDAIAPPLAVAAHGGNSIAPQLAVASYGGEVARIPDVAPPMTSILVPAAAPCDPGVAPRLSTPPQSIRSDPHSTNYRL